MNVFCCLVQALDEEGDIDESTQTLFQQLLTLFVSTFCFLCSDCEKKQEVGA